MRINNDPNAFNIHDVHTTVGLVVFAFIAFTGVAIWDYNHIASQPPSIWMWLGWAIEVFVSIVLFDDWVGITITTYYGYKRDQGDANG